MKIIKMPIISNFVTCECGCKYEFDYQDVVFWCVDDVGGNVIRHYDGTVNGYNVTKCPYCQRLNKVGRDYKWQR